MSYRKDGLINFGGGSSDCKFEFIVPFLRVKTIGGQIAIPPRLYFSKCIDNKFKNSSKTRYKNSGVKTNPQNPRASVLSYAQGA